MSWRSGISVPARDRRDEEQRDRDPDHPERDEARPALDLATPSGDEREAEHEQQVADDGTGQRAAHDLRQPLVDGDQRDDQLGRVPERRVEEAADPGAGVLGRVLGCLSDQPGERDQSRRGEDEQRRVAELRHVVEDDDHGASASPATRSFLITGSGYPTARWFERSSSTGATRWPRGSSIRTCSSRGTSGASRRSGRAHRAGSGSRPRTPRRCCRCCSPSGRTRSTTAPRSRACSNRSARPPNRQAVDRFLVAEQRVWRPSHRARGVGARAARRAPRARAPDRPRLEPVRSARVGARAARRRSGCSSASTRSPSPPRSASGSRIPPSSSMRSPSSESRPRDAVMVGDRLREDVGGAQALGLRAIQALWFAADDAGTVRSPTRRPSRPTMCCG